MQKQFISSLVTVSAFILFSTHALADSFSISWGSDGHHERQPPEVRETGNGPPAHAPAHGYRSHHRYQYYPSASVYHDAGRGLYFYLSGSSWQVSASLPQALQVRLGSSVSMEMDTDKPYLHYEQHKRQYPPGHSKKGKKHKGGKKGRK